MWSAFIAAGLAYLFLRDRDERPEPTPEPTPEPEPEPSPEPTPTPPTTWTETARWSGEEVVDNWRGVNVVWLFEKGIRYTDGTAKFDPPKVVIGNANHTAFIRSNSDRGTTDISKEESGGDVDMYNVNVYPSIQAALDYLNEPEPAPRPGDPSREPEDDEDDGGNGGGFGGLPAQPGFGFGNSYTPSFGNGGM